MCLFISDHRVLVRSLLLAHYRVLVQYVCHEKNFYSLQFEFCEVIRFGEEALCLNVLCVYFLLNAALAFENVLMKMALVWILLVKI